MFDGSTGGRAFESPLAPYIFGAILIVSVILWAWFAYDLRRDSNDPDKGKDQPGSPSQPPGDRTE